MRRALIIIGVVVLLIGIAWPWLTRGNWWSAVRRSHLPGDIHIEREGFSFHFPLVTCILISLLVTLVLWLIRR